MPFYIRVTSLINLVHCITQTEEPSIFRDLRFDNVPFRAGLILLQSDFQSWDIIPTQVPSQAVGGTLIAIKIRKKVETF
jgi:hypothetical protein